MAAAFTVKQQEVWRETMRKHHRWNFQIGAARSGKTYLDYFRIPARVRRTTGSGLIVLMGNTRATIERNILEPMRGIWGEGMIGRVRSSGEINLFGRSAWALGADNISMVERIRGSSIEYCYGDEIPTWHRDVFDMLKSRLDRPNSTFDGTGNPAAPTHWLKVFLDSDADIYSMHYSIDDNTFLDPVFVRELKKEYAGSVLYDRYIEGLWVAAEGVIYKLLADNPERYIIDELPESLAFGTIGIDFGGNKSGHSFTFTGLPRTLDRVVTIADHYRQGIITPAQLETDFISFLLRCQSYKIPIVDIRADSAEQVLIAGLNSALIAARMPYQVQNAIKGPIIDRIRLYTLLLARDRWQIMRDCESTIGAFRSALYDSKSMDDRRLDDGTTVIDPIDSQEYSTEPYAEALLYGR
ncbi:MAG: PBSX family phage terminase large subunit [Bacillota bacterium]|nr:PBSX family phage terminase large subunit [Bacillota bacterium]